MDLTCSVLEDAIKIVRGLAAEWERLLANQAFDKHLASRTYKE